MATSLLPWPRPPGPQSAVRTWSPLKLGTVRSGHKPRRTLSQLMLSSVED